jgi:hypothetical protein
MPMTVLIALLIFLGVAAATWAVGIALYQGWLGGPELRQQPEFSQVSALAVGFVALTSPVPFPWGYVLSLVIWGLAAGHLNLPWPRAVALFLILAALSFLSRLVLFGTLEWFWPAPPAPAAAWHPGAPPLYDPR